MNEQEQTNVEEEKTEFKITDDPTANWAFQKLAEDEKKLKELKEQRDVYYRQADEWYQRHVNKVIDKRDYMQHLIEEYRLTKKDKKVDVPAGKTSVRHNNTPIYDDDKLIEYVKANAPEMLKYSVNKSDFKKTIKDVNGNAVDRNGQIVDGMKFEKTESVSFKLNK